MSMEPLARISSRVVLLLRDDIDTDQIIPARFLKTTEKTGLATSLFADWRYGPQGTERPDFPLNLPDARGAHVLVAGRNFGCGSSREHAVWALVAAGFRAVIAPSFADIFRNNAAKNGLLAVPVDLDLHAAVVASHARDSSLVVTIDLEEQRVLLPDGASGQFPVDPFVKRCLLNGLDELGYLLSFSDRIEAHEAAHV